MRAHKYIESHRPAARGRGTGSTSPSPDGSGAFSGHLAPLADESWPLATHSPVRTSDLLQGGEMGRPAGHWSLRLSPLARPCQSVTAPLQAATPLLSSLLKDLLPVSSHFHILSLFLSHTTHKHFSHLFHPKEYPLTAHLLALSTNLPAAKA